MQTITSNQRAHQQMILKRRYNNARSNLLLVVAFSFINLFLLVTNSFTYFLFSASVPYMLADVGRYLCGMYPDGYYEAGFTPLPPVVFWIMLIIAAVIVSLYLLCYFLSKNGKVGWLIFALVFFVLDTLTLFIYFEIGTNMIADIVFHVWVIVLLAMGIHADVKFKQLPPAAEAPLPTTEATPFDAPEDAAFDSKILRRADLEIKSRTLLEFETYGHKVVYRRAKKINELIIDGNVYDEYTAPIEKPHMLTAVVEGHTISVGLENSMSFGIVDGLIVAEKKRMF